jgi:histidinol-phosphate aminotransferase
MAFDEMNLQYIPSVGNFICVDIVTTTQTGMEIYNKLLHRGVIVRPVENYGLPNHLRVTVGLKQENEKFIQALKSTLTAMDVEA